MIKKKKLILSIILFIVIVFLTFYIIFSKNDISGMWAAINSINIKYIILLCIMMISYFFVQGIFFKELLKTLNIKINILRGTFYAIVEFFFSAITPGSAGGQPLVLYYMGKDGISMKKSPILLMYSTIMFKIYIMFFSIIIILFKSDLITSYGPIVFTMFVLGIICDIVIVSVYLLFMYSKKVIRVILNGYYSIVNKLFKKGYNIEEKINESLNQYSNNANLIKKDIPKLLKCLLITFIQRTIMFSMVYVIYRGFGFNGFGYFEFLLLQVFIQMCLEAMFVPGATGVSELLSNSLFVTYFGSLATTSMLLFRTMSFYVPLIVISILIFIIVKIKYKKD